MRIEFDPTNRDEATAVRAVLAALHGAEPVTITKREASPLVLTDEEITETIGLEPDETYSGEPVTDANNEPHDPRIHSTPAKTNADGTWRAKRGVTAEQVAAVRAERNLTATDAELIEQAEPLEIEPAQEQSAPPAPNAPVEEQPAPLAESAESAPATPPAPPVSEPSNTHTAAPTPPAPTVPAGSSGEYSFLDVMKAITAAQKAGKVDTAKVKELCAAIGAGDSTMGLNGADKGELRVQFMALLSAENGE